MHWTGAGQERLSWSELHEEGVWRVLLMWIRACVSHGAVGMGRVVMSSC